MHTRSCVHSHTHTHNRWLFRALVHQSRWILWIDLCERKTVGGLRAQLSTRVYFVTALVIAALKRAPEESLFNGTWKRGKRLFYLFRFFIRENLAPELLGTLYVRLEKKKIEEWFSTLRYTTRLLFQKSSSKIHFAQKNNIGTLLKVKFARNLSWES